MCIDTYQDNLFFFFRVFVSCMGTPFTAIKILLIRFVFLLKKKKKLSSTIVEAHKLSNLLLILNQTLHLRNE